MLRTHFANIYYFIWERSSWNETRETLEFDWKYMFKIIQEKSKTAEFALRYWHDFNDFLPSVNFWT